MRILFDHFSPFLLAHGGFQIQIEQSKIALEQAGLEVDFLRWWDAAQKGDIIHFFGPPPPGHIEFAHQKNIKFVVTRLLGGLGVRPAWQRSLQKTIVGVALQGLPDGVLNRIGWKDWGTADAYIAITSWEAELMSEVFRAPSERVHVVPNGVSDIFSPPPKKPAGEWLITTASILPVKRIVETAQAAVAAQTPYWIVGQPFSESDSYFRTFSDLCRRHPNVLRYDNAMHAQADLAKIYGEARGFVLLSRWETQSLSALEAAACGLPLLLSDLPWAHSTFGDEVSYCSQTAAAPTAECLRRFYDRAPELSPPARPPTWKQVAEKLGNIYESVLAKK